MHGPRFFHLFVAVVAVALTVFTVSCWVGAGRAQAFVFYDSLSFVDAQHGWLSGMRAGVSTTPLEILWRTTDGGGAWKRVGSAVQPTGFKTFVTFTSRTTGFWWNYRGLFRTTNGGRSWKHVRGLVPSEGTVAFVDAKVGWLAGSRTSLGEGGSVYRTTNGGLTWHRVLYHNARNRGYHGTTFYRVSSPSRRRCYVLESDLSIARGPILNAVWSTYDGGVHWARKKLPRIAGLDRYGLESSYSDVDFPGAVVGWAVGSRGTILKTTNAGLSWKKQRSGTLANLSEVCFATTRDGFVVGDRGVILHTKDGGVHWTRQSSRTSDYLEGIDRVGLSWGWVIDRPDLDTGSFATSSVLWTTNGGRTWRKL